MSKAVQYALNNKYLLSNKLIIRDASFPIHVTNTRYEYGARNY